MGLPFRSNSEGIIWDYQMDISFWSKSGGIRWDYLLEVKQMYQVELSDGITIWKQLEEVSSETIKWTYHFEVKAEVSNGTIRWNYLLEVKQRYQAELSNRITIWKW